jgi:hypothetical protein
VSTDWTPALTALATGLTTGGVAVFGQWMITKRQTGVEILKIRDTSRQKERDDQRLVFKAYLGGYRNLQMALSSSDNNEISAQFRGLAAIGDEATLLGGHDVEASLSVFETALEAALESPQSLNSREVERCRAALVAAMAVALRTSVADSGRQ